MTTSSALLAARDFRLTAFQALELVSWSSMSDELLDVRPCNACMPRYQTSAMSKDMHACKVHANILSLLTCWSLNPLSTAFSLLLVSQQVFDLKTH